MFEAILAAGFIAVCAMLPEILYVMSQEFKNWKE